MNWMKVEDYLKQRRPRRPPRWAAPSSTRSFACRSIRILSEKVAPDAAEPLGVPVFPIVPSGSRPISWPFPARSPCGCETYLRGYRGHADCLQGTGLQAYPDRQWPWRQRPAAALAHRVDGRQSRTCAVKFHNWCNAPQTLAKVQEIDPVASHASWMENFPWTRLAGRELPTQQKPMIDLARMRAPCAQEVRALLR